MRCSCRLVALVLAVLCAASAALAAPVYSFRFDGQTTGSYQVNTGSTVAVNVYLYEILSVGDTSRLIAGNGLATGGVRLSLVNGGVGAQSDVLSTSNIAINTTSPAPGFNDPLLLQRYIDSNVTTNYGAGPAGTTPIASVTGGIDFFDPAYATAGLQPQTVSGAENGYRVLLGTFTFTAGDFGNQITIQASRLGDSISAISTYSPYSGLSSDLDGFLTGTYTATITVVPEPPTIAAFTGLASMGLVYWAVYGRRRRRSRDRSRSRRSSSSP